MQASIESLAEQRWKHVIRQGLDISCGSAALATIINYQFGDQISEEVIIRTILATVKAEDVRKRGGFSLLDLKRVGSALGYTVKGYRLTFEQLKANNTPALVPITVRGFKHFVVFRGALDDRVALADPSFGNIVLSNADFIKAWQGIALILQRADKPGADSSLAVRIEDLPRNDYPDTLRTFISRPLMQGGARRPDEF
jgi:predicted double-glycine peptidase